LKDTCQHRFYFVRGVNIDLGISNGIQISNLQK